MRTSHRLLAIPLLITAASLSSCAAIAVGAAAVVVSQDVLDNNVYVATLDRGPDQVWASAKVALNHASMKPIDAQDDMRKATATIDDATVTVSVETYDLNRSTLRVSAKKYGVNNGQIAKMVYDKILNEIEH
ncbi:MAG TPA: DUF3568 family protein [Planctomycetota bacterium]|jgi:hypothetical protein|nr:DUF3568 family protein [Planctomycetota bacterium]